VSRWGAVIAARAHSPLKRTPFFVAHTEATPVPVGSVARAHLAALRRWPQWLQVYDDAVTLLAAPAARDDVLARINDALRADGLIRAWRDESFPLYTVHGRPIDAAMERAAMRFWGALTVGAHCNGYVTDSHIRPASLWIARRSFSKATDPGRLDNLVGGGVPVGQTPRETLVREAWEEAGLTPRQMHGLARGRVLRLLREIPEGLQREWIHVYDLALPVGLTPRNQDGEVAEVHLHPLADALALAAGDEMTVDAALVTLDFALRHRLLDDDDQSLLEEAAAVLYQGQAA